MNPGQGLRETYKEVKDIIVLMFIWSPDVRDHYILNTFKGQSAKHTVYKSALSYFSLHVLSYDFATEAEFFFDLRSRDIHSEQWVFLSEYEICFSL